jgi:hypothetical protein
MGVFLLTHAHNKYIVSALCLHAGSKFPNNRYFFAYPHLLELILVVRLLVRLLVRCVTEFNKNCRHLLSARRWQLVKNC